MITVPEFWRTLQKWGMGTLGWTEDQTLDADMNAIILAHEGRWDMINEGLRAIFGDPKPAVDELPALTPAAMRTMGK